MWLKSCIVIASVIGHDLLASGEQFVGVRISKEGEGGIRTRKVSVSFQIFFAKQMYFCLANRISKFRATTRDREVS